MKLILIPVIGDFYHNTDIYGMQFRDWLLSEIHWYSFPLMNINGIEADGIDFNFERYPSDILVDRKALVMASPVSAALDDGTWLNVIPEKSAGTGNFRNMNLGQYQAWQLRRATRPDLGGAPSLDVPNDQVRIEPQPLPNAIKLPRIWFKTAKLFIGQQEVKAAGEERLQPIPR